MKKNILLIYIVVMLIIAGCAVKNKVNLQTEVLVNKVNMEEVVVPLSYNKLKTNEAETLLWKKGSIESYDDKYLTACSDNVPKKAIERISKELNFSNSFLELGESLIYYSNQSNYELFLAESEERLKWKIYFLYDDIFKEVIIEHDEEMILEGYQIEDDCIYLFSKKVYKVNLKDYSTNLIINAEKLFGIDSTGDMVLVNDNIFVNAINLSMKSEEDTYKGVYYLYNSKTGETNTISEKDRIADVFPYKDGYIVKCSKAVSWKPCLKYYDKNFKFIKEESIDISSEYGNVTFGYYGGISYLYNNKIYTFMKVDSSIVEEIVIIDADTAEVLYQMELTYKERNGFFLTGADFCRFGNGELFDLNKF